MDGGGGLVETKSNLRGRTLKRMSHTPGPWKMEPGEPELREGWSIGAPDSPHPLGAHYTREDNVVGKCCSAGVYREEDARLICAAPDLLMALKDVTHSLERAMKSLDHRLGCDCSVCRDVKRGFEAIKKATVVPVDNLPTGR